MKKSRKELLAINSLFTKFIVDLQLSYKFTPYEEGESILLNSEDKATVLTQALAKQLNDEQNVEFEKNRDTNPFENTESTPFIKSCLTVPAKKHTTEYLNDIANVLETIRIELEETDLMILGVQNTPWLSQNNEYLPVNNALKYLSNSIDNNFDGGFILKEKGLLEFIPHLFWLTRCNAGLPYFYMSYPKSKTIITLCKYGVLHFDFYNEKEKLIIEKIVSDMNFKELDSCNDPIEFDEFEGRQLKA